MARFFVFSAACGNARMFDSAGWILSYNGFDMGFIQLFSAKITGIFDDTGICRSAF